jgi:hypothetical protein
MDAILCDGNVLEGVKVGVVEMLHVITGLPEPY